jgi:hypothetical protein
MTCADAVKKLLKNKKAWEVGSAGTGSKGERWSAWAWLAVASPQHSVLVRRHLKTGDLAFHYCFVPEGQAAPKARLIRAAGLRWPVEESFELGKGCFGLDQCQARLYTAIRRHTVLVMAPSRSALSLPPCSGTAPTARRRRHQGRTTSRPPTPGSSLSPSARSGACSPPPSAARNRPATSPAGSNGDAATRHDHAGSTNVPALHATTPWSASDWRLPYYPPICVAQDGLRCHVRRPT